MIRLPRIRRKRKKRKSQGRYPTYGRRPPTLESKGGKRSSAPRTRRKPQRGSIIGALFSRLQPLLRPLIVVAGITILYLWLSLPSISDLDRLAKARGIVIKSENGVTLGSYGDIYGDYVKYKDLPEPLIQAVLATEDRNFFHHFGVDPFGIARAMFVNVRAGQVVQGGSTVTQQLAKNLFLTPERTMARKLRELMLALRLEARYSKEEILTLYLNRVYLGAGNYGVDAASRRYFGKSAREITLPEAAILAGLLKAPSRFAPTSNPELAQRRAEQVLLNMEDAGFLKEPQVKKAAAQIPSALKKSGLASQSNLYFTDWIVDQLPDYVGGVEDDLVVITTLIPEYQQAASKAIGEVMDKSGAEMQAEQAALLAIATDGAVRAMVGGRDYGDSQFNRAFQSRRQPGSSFKLFVYLTALENGYTPSSLVEDKPITIGKWRPQNYTNEYEGTISLRQAVAQSINSVAVQISESIGRDNVIQMAHRLGIKSPIYPAPALALGASELSLFELTGAYAHLPAGGRIVVPYGITEIRTAEGKVLYVRENFGRGQALRASVVGMMNEMLTGVVEYGTGRAARFGRPIAGKTGTTSDYKDAWFVGFTPQLTAGVWVGNDDATPMKKVTGGGLPAQIWRAFMVSAMAGQPVMSIPTSGSDGGDSPLPWQTQRGSGFFGLFQETSPHDIVIPATEPEVPQPVQSNTLPPAPASQPAPAGQSDEYELAPSFWDALERAAPQRR